MKIVFLDTYSMGDSDLAPISRLGVFTGYETTRPEEVVERCAEADVVIVNKVKLMRPEIDALPNLKLICVSATGVNNVDTGYAESKGIPVKNVAGYSTESVTEATFALALALLRNVVYYDRYVRDGSYADSGLIFNLNRSVSEIKGKTWGIIGLGTIGRRVAAVAEAFGAKIVYYSTSGVKRDEKYTEKTWDDFLAESDIVSVHSPLNERTKGLIGYGELKKMKPSAILINVARGGIIDEQALAQALNEGVIAGAGLDVFEYEPMLPENPLLKVADPNRLVMAPHCAWTSQEARKVLVEGIAQNIQRFSK